MTRQSISFTEPNDSWLNSLIESKEYKSKSEIINDLIRRERANQNILTIRNKLINSENSGFVAQSADEIKEEFKAELKLNGRL